MSAATTTPTPAPRAPAAADAATPMALLTGVELRKMVDTRAGRWLLIGTALALVAVLGISVGTGGADDRSFHELAGLAQFPIAVLLPILGVLAATSEWSQRAVLTTFSLTPSRGRVITAKVLASLVLAAVAFVAAFAFAAVAALIAPAVGETSSNWSIGLSDLAQIAVFDALNMLLGVALGMALLSSGLAIVLYFVLPTLWSAITSAFSGLHDVQRWLDTGVSWMHLIDGGMTGKIWAQVGTTALLWIALPLAIGTARILRRDID